MLLSTSSSSPSCNSRPGTYTYRNVNTRKSSYVVQLHAPALDAHLRLRRLRPLLSTTSSRHKQAKNKTRIVYTAIRNLPCPYRLLRPLPFRRHLLRLKRGLRIAAPPPLCLSKQSKHIRSRLVANMPNLRRNEASSSCHLFHFLSMRRSPFLGLSGGRFILPRHGSEFHVHGVTWCFDQNHFRKKEHALGEFLDSTVMHPAWLTRMRFKRHADWNSRITSGMNRGYRLGHGHGAAWQCIVLTT